MKPWDLQTGVIRLTRAVKKLRDQWREAQQSWDDQNSREFARHHLDPLAPQLTLTLSAVQRLGDVLEQAWRECSDEQDDR